MATIMMTGAFAGYFIAAPLDRRLSRRAARCLAMAAILAVAVADFDDRSRC